MKKRYKSKKEGEYDPMLPHGMRLSEFQRLTASRCGSAGYVVPVPPTVWKTMPDGSKQAEALHTGTRKRMVALDPGSKTQRRKENRTKGDDSKYNAQVRHRSRNDGRQATGNRRKALGQSKRQVLKTCGHPFEKSKGYVDAPKQGCPGNAK